MQVSDSDKNKIADVSWDREQLGLRLREAREYLNLSQDEVARQLGVARAAISLIESGQRRVEAIELAKFAKIYKRPTSYFTNDPVAESELPTEIAFAARAVQGLSKKDLAEVARFADFLRSKKQAEEGQD